MKNHKNPLLILLAAVTALSILNPYPLQSKESSKGDRAQIMDTLRMDFYGGNREKARSNPEDIKFVVKYYKIDSNWACLQVTPTKNGKEHADPRWAILQKVKGEWINKNYFKALKVKDEDDALDVLGFEADTGKRVKKAFPTIPTTILP